MNNEKISTIKPSLDDHMSGLLRSAEERRQRQDRLTKIFTEITYLCIVTGIIFWSVMVYKAAIWVTSKF